MAVAHVGVGTLNAPFRHYGEGLLPQPQRTKAIPTLLVQNEIEVCGLNEFAKGAGDIWRRGGSSFTLKVPPFNTVRRPHRNAPPGQNSNGNAIAVRSSLKTIDFTWIDLPFFRGPLHIPVVLLEEPATGARFAFIQVHFPTRRDTVRRPSTRARMNKQVERYANGLVQRGVPTIVAGDRNDGRKGIWADWKTGGHHKVDWIYGKGLTFSNSRTVTKGVQGRVSDRHSLLRTTAHIPVGARAVRFSNLPKGH